MERGTTSPNRQCHFYIQSPPQLLIWALTLSPLAGRNKRVSLAPGYSETHAPTTLNYAHEGFTMPFYLENITPTAEQILKEYSAQHQTPSFHPNLTLNHGQIQDHGEKSEVFRMHPAEALSYIGEILHKEEIPHLLVFESPRPVVLDDNSGLASRLKTAICKATPDLARRDGFQSFVERFNLL
jgi:hypothetical protein